MKKVLYIILLASVSILTACEKKNLVEDTKYDVVQPADPKFTYLKFLNLTPSSPVVNYYLEGSKFSAQLSSTGVENAGYAYNGIYPDLGYAVTSPGTHKLTAKIIPTATTDKNLEVLNTTINPVAGKYYTIFTTGVYSSTNKSIGPILMLEDVRPPMDTTKIVVRVVNLYNGSPNIDLIRISNGAKVASNVAYGSASPWTDITNPGSGAAPALTYNLTNAATNAVLVSNISMALTKGRAYTIYLRGILGNSSFPLTGTFYTTFY